MKTLKSILAVALCAVGLTAVAADPEAVQLWEGGPYWATVNVGAEKPEDYGILTNFNDAAQAVTDALGAGWRLPTQADFENLLKDENCTKAWDATKKGYTFTSKADPSKSIFLPAAGYNQGSGRSYAGSESKYWSSTELDGADSFDLYFYSSGAVKDASLDTCSRSYGLSVRAVRDTPKPISLGEVKSHEPWDGKFDVEYTLKGLDADVDYKVAFDVTADSKSASVTNAAAKLANGTYTNTLDTTELFGAKTMNKKAEITARLIKVESAESLGGVQLWEGGPFWAEANLGESEVDGHPEYGALYNFDDAGSKVKALLGPAWRVPSKEDFDNLLNCTKQWTQQGGVNGYLFTSKSDSSKSLFLPAAGWGFNNNRFNPENEGNYWSFSEAENINAWCLVFSAGTGSKVDRNSTTLDLSVRAVRGVAYDDEIGKDGPKAFCLGPSVYGHDLRRLKAYLHEIWYDYYEDSDLTGDDAPFGDLPVPGLGGCSSVRVGDFHGRNLDLGISDLASIVVHVKADEGRFASVGTTQWGDVSETALTTNGVSVHRFDVLPSWMLDGINEKGVAINVNVVPTDVPQDGDDPGSDTRPALHARKVVRYVLDHAESAAGVIEDLKKFRIHGNIGTGTYYLHWMISDAEKTFVVEIINGEVVAREHPIMTNFNLNWNNKEMQAITPSEFASWGPDKYFNPAIYSDNTDKILEVYTPHGDGVERYLTLRDAPYTTMGATFEGMFELMRLARYSRVADLPLDQTFRSDLAEIAEVKSAGLDDIAKVYAAENFEYLQEVWQTLQPDMTNVYANIADHRKPGEMGEYSITSHNVTFDLAKKMFRIVVQEEYNEPFDFYLAQPKVEVVGDPVVFPDPSGAPLANIGFRVASDVGGTNLVFEVAAYTKDRDAYFTDGDISLDNGDTFTQDVLKWHGTAGATQDVHLVWNWERHNPDLDWDDVTVEVTAKVQGEDVAVKCQNGVFVGVRDSVSGVVAFKSVPYAKPPTRENNLRWKPPVKPDVSDAVVSARHFGPAAAQTRSDGEVPSYGPLSEDCLKLSIWTAGGFTPTDKRPVLFFIHGGSYGWGGMSDPLYDGERLVRDNPDVVLVSCDYRVNAFGFLDLSGLPGYDPAVHGDYDQSVNLGILDQQAGLRWVQENIAQFGGDPGNVTIFGESAGGGSVSCLLQAKGSEGLFRRAIVMSGTVDLTDLPETYGDSNQAYCMMKAAGKSSLDEFLDCTTEELLAALNTPLDDPRLATVRHMRPREGGPLVADLNNRPMCDDARGIVPSDPFGSFATSTIAKNVDVMIGTTSEELNYWAMLMHGMSREGTPSAEDPLGYYYCNFLSNWIGRAESLYARAGNETAIPSFLAGPGSSHPFDANPDYNLGGLYPNIWGRTELASELSFRIPSVIMAEQHLAQVEAAAGTGKTYMYYFCRPWKSIAMPWKGACHACELTSVFKNLHLDVDGGEDAKKELAENVSGAFVAFAKTGDPGANWAAYDTAERRTTVIGTKGDFADAGLRVESDPDRAQRVLLQADYLRYREEKLRTGDMPVYGHNLRAVKPYLHEIWYDNYEDSDLTGPDAPFGDEPSQYHGGCSSVRVGDFHGRNLDIGVGDTATIVVHTKAAEGRFASVGTTQWADVSETALKADAVGVHRFDVLPNWMLDGINENGVAINVNVIPMDVVQEGDPGVVDERPALPARKVVRYVLDHAESAAGVIEQLKQFRIYGNTGTGTYNLHWMISDAGKTFVVEVIGGEVVAREHPIMTNFSLNWDNANQRAITDPENWGPSKYVNPAVYRNVAERILETYTRHAEGVERYIRLRDADYETRGKTFEGMFDLMREVRFSRIAELPLAETFLSDLPELQETEDAGILSLTDIYAASNATKLAGVWSTLQPGMSSVYGNLADFRKPDMTANYSITTHNVTFDLARKMFRIVVQEEYEDPFDFWLVEPAKVTLPAAVSPVAADTVVYGTIRTAEEGNPVAEAIAVKDGKYVYVGDEAGAAAYIEDGVTEIVDRRGKGMVMPGCTDGHSHYTMKFGMDNMKGGVMFALEDGKDEVLRKVEAAAEAAKAAGKESLFGFGWNYVAFTQAPLTLKELDDATFGVSAIIFDQGGHHAFCNSECLKRCGIIDGKGNVLITRIDGGLLELDDKGYPTGYADERVTGYWMRMGGINPDEIIDDEAAEASIAATRDLLLSTGYTTALDGWSNMFHPSKLYEAAKRMDDKGDLKLVFPMTYEVEPWQTNMTGQIEYLASLKETYGTRHVLPEYLKIFMDGVVETKTGALVKPFVDDHQTYKSFWSTNRLADITRACNAKGLTVHVHTMGDAAIRDVVDAYIQGGDGTHRNCLVHLRNVRKEDFQRFAANNIACTAGFTWHAASEEEGEYLAEFLDKEYVGHAYPIQSFFNAGVKVSSHSDYPANIPCPQDPFGIMQVAVTGMVPDSREGDKPYDANELITVEQAFQALTLNGAWQLGLENERGSIKVGKWADFVLADQDVFECEAADIGKTKVVSTWFEGEKVYSGLGASEE